MYRPLCSSALEMAQMIRDGEYSSRELVAAHIEYAQRVNPSINAIVHDRYQEALAEAKRADLQLRNQPSDQLPPFHGVPCTIKENFALSGMRQTSGLLARRHHIASEDAPTVARLRAAGAIPIGVSNVPELCMWVESHNRIYGRTRNPYNPAHIAGGSSGGEGAIIGSGASPFGLGADVAGSIRLPAFFNGTFGHKPSAGTVPTTGQHPAPENAVRGYCQPGPICRRAGDLMPLLRILAGPDGTDGVCTQRPFGDPSAVDISSLQVFQVPDDSAHPVSADLYACQAQAARALATSGAAVTETRIRDLRHAFNIWAALMAEESSTPFGALLGNGQRVNAVRELGRFVLGRSSFTLPSIGLALLEEAPMPHGYFVARGYQLREQLLNLLGDNGVMLYPTFISSAPRHRRPMLRPLDYGYTAIINVMGLPATQVPMGLNAAGLPIGFQIVGPPGADHLTIAVACHLEKLFGGWIPPWRAGGKAVHGFGQQQQTELQLHSATA